MIRAAALPGGKRQRLVLTLAQRDRLDVEGVRVDVEPAWEWLSRRG